MKQETNRDVLRRVLAEKAQHDQNIRHLHDVTEGSFREKRSAANAVRDAEDALDDAKAGQVLETADAMRGGDAVCDAPRNNRAAREKLVEAQDHLEAVTKAANRLKADLDRHEKSPLRFNVNAALAAVLEQPAQELLARAIQTGKTFAAQKAALKHLLSQNVIQGSLSAQVNAFLRDESLDGLLARAASGFIADANPRGDIGDLIDAVARLRTDADTQIPVI